MADSSLMYWSDKLGRTQYRVATFGYEITAAKTVSPLVQGQPALTTFDAIATQAEIDGFLGTTNEFTAAQYDGTSMGLDTFGLIADMGKQVEKLVLARIDLYTGTDNDTLAQKTVVPAGLTDTTLETAAALGADGNVALKADILGLDADTSGVIMVHFHWLAK